MPNGTGRARFARTRSRAIIGTLPPAAPARCAPRRDPADARARRLGDALRAARAARAAQPERLDQARAGPAGRRTCRSGPCGRAPSGSARAVWNGRKTALRPENAPPTSWVTPVGAPSEVGALNRANRESNFSSEGSVSSNISTSSARARASRAAIRRASRTSGVACRAPPGSCGAGSASPSRSAAVSVGQRRRQPARQALRCAARRR